MEPFLKVKIGTRSLILQLSLRSSKENAFYVRRFARFVNSLVVISYAKLVQVWRRTQERSRRCQKKYRIWCKNSLEKTENAEFGWNQGTMLQNICVFFCDGLRFSSVLRKMVNSMVRALAPVCFEVDSGLRQHHSWVEFIGSLLCSERFFFLQPVTVVALSSNQVEHLIRCVYFVYLIKFTLFPIMEMTSISFSLCRSPRNFSKDRIFLALISHLVLWKKT